MSERSPRRWIRAALIGVVLVGGALAGVAAFPKKGPTAETVYADSLDLGLAAWARGDLERAEKHLRRAADRRNGDEARLWLGRVLAERGAEREARELLTAAGDRAKGNPEWARVLAAAWERMGEGALALEWLEVVVRLRPVDPRARRDLGLAQHRWGDPRALESLNESLALNPDQPDLIVLAARISSERSAPDGGKFGEDVEGRGDGRPRPVNPEDFMPGSTAPDPHDLLPKSGGRR